MSRTLPTARPWATMALYAASCAAVTLGAQAITPGRGSAQGTATAALTGTVVTWDGTLPVRRAIVTVTGGDLDYTRTVISDDDGHFACDGLPAGRFTLTATKPGYVVASYGATSPGRPGTRLALTVGQHATDVTIRMAHGAAITGMVRDQYGEPVADIELVAVRTDAPPAIPIGPPSLASEFSTDDRGVYRIFGLAPGTYLVGATLGRQAQLPGQTEMWSSTEMDAALLALAQRTALFGGPTGVASASPDRSTAPEPSSRAHPYGYAPSYYPGTPDVSAAVPVTLAAGEERAGMDILLRPVPTATVEGAVIYPNGPVPAVQLQFTADRLAPLPSFGMQPSLAVRPGADGRFTYVGVAPGRYTITARTGAAPVTVVGGMITINRAALADTASVLWASAEVTVTGDDLSGVTLALQPAARLAGHVVFDATTLAPPADLSAIRITLAQLGTGGGALPPTVPNGAVSGRVGTAPVAVRPDGSFELPNVLPGSYVIGATVSGATGWWLRTALVAGQDVLDVPLDVPIGGGEIPTALLTFSDRHTALTGTLETPQGLPATDYVVIAFSTDRAFWRPGSRRLLSTRPASDGTYELPDVPPGAYYLAALTDLDPNTWQEADFLDQVVPSAVQVTIGEGVRLTQNLRLAR